MTSRERFHATMNYGSPDRAPYFEEGMREDVIEAWRAQGLPPDVDPDTMFPTDHREHVGVNLNPLPPFEEWQPTRQGLKELAKRLDPDAPGRLPANWTERVAAWKQRDYVLGLPISRGFFLTMGVGDFRTFLPVMYLLFDDPALVEGIMRTSGECWAGIAEKVLREVEIDYALFSEPIGGNDGPLLSPKMYERFVLRAYQPILDVLRRFNVSTIIFQTYANARVLIRSVLNAGMNCLWACEVNVEAMDYLSLRQEFGRDLRLIGGIDLDVLLQSKCDITREIQRKVPPLLQQGGYVPVADGRVRANVPLENYLHYRKVLRQVTEHEHASQR